MDRNNKFNYSAGNVNSAYNNPKFMTVISISVSDKLGRSLTKGEQTFIVNMIKKIDEDYLRSKNTDDVISSLTQVLIRKLTESACSPMDGAEHVDMHEKLKDHIGTTGESDTSHSIYDRALTSTKTILKPPSGSVTSFLGLSKPIDVMRRFNPHGLLKKNYFLLDSRYKSTSSTKNRFIWDYSNDKNQQTGTVNVIGNVRDIVSLRIYPFRLPYVSSADSKHRRISLLIHEFSSQSFFAHEDRRFHFMMETSIDNQYIDCNPYKQNDAYYHFEKPFTTFTSITISFGNPLQLIELEKDRDKCSADYFGITPLTQITTLTDHGLKNGDRVYLSNFDVGLVDSLLLEQFQINNIIKNKMNREEGFLITVFDATNFSINFDSSNIQNPIAGLLFDVFYDSKRFYIPFEVEYVSPIE
jgi:hypothetical protein